MGNFALFNPFQIAFLPYCRGDGKKFLSCVVHVLLKFVFTVYQCDGQNGGQRHSTKRKVLRNKQYLINLRLISDFLGIS
jgi:hypothetical protein